MITIEMPEAPDVELDLQPRIDAFRGGETPAEARDRLKGRLTLGGPVHRRIGPDSTDDAELRHFLEQEAADSDFYLVHLTCTLAPPADEPFVEALVELELMADDGAAPIAWSMQPDRLAHSVEISRTVNLGPSLQILGIGVEAGVERGTTRQRDEVFLEALYELESTPSWGLYRTGSADLKGLQRFHVVVRAPKGSHPHGIASVEAKVERKRLGIIPYTAEFPGAPKPIAFTLESR